MQSAALEMIGEMYVVGEMDEGVEHGDEDVRGNCPLATRHP